MYGTGRISLLHFADPPRVVLAFGTNIDAGNIAEASDVYLSCEIRSHPAAYKVTWVRNVSDACFDFAQTQLSIVSVVSQLISFESVSIAMQGVRVLPEPSSGVRILSGGRDLVLQVRVTSVTSLSDYSTFCRRE